MTATAETMNDLCDAIRADYDDEPTEVRLLRDGQAGNKTYLVLCGEQKSILRVYGAYWQGRRDWIDFELELLRFLQAQEVSVAVPIARRDGRLLGETPTPDGLRYVARFIYAEGTMEWPMSEAKSHVLGATLAKLHRAADAFPMERPVREYDFARLIDRPLERMRPYLADHAEAREYLEELGERIKTCLRRIGAAQGEYGVIHGDVHQGNCHFAPSGRPMLFDFSLCGVGWRAYDLAGFLWPLRDATIQEAPYRCSCDAFLAGYRSVRALTPAEQEAIPAFVKARDFWETGDWLECDQNPDPACVANGILELVQRFQLFPAPLDLERALSW